MFATPPHFIRGRIRAAWHFSLEQITQARTDVESTRAWTLWLLLPRMLLHRTPGTRTLPKEEWRRRLHAFQQGDWHHLLHHSDMAEANQATTTSTPTPERRAERARHLVHQGELSAARQALTATPPAPGTESTLAQLQDPARRPPAPYPALHPTIHQFAPDQPLQLPVSKLLTALRRSRKGAAPGPSGLTADTLRLVLDDDATTALFVDVCQLLAQARVPPNIAKAIGLGRLVALQKPNGGVRGLVVGDVLRRVVSRCIAQMFSSHIHTACSPQQFALSTRAGTGAVLHALTTATEHNHNSTILSIDGIGAYDNISRNSMLQGLCNTPEANRCLPYVRLWYTTESEYVWHDAQGQPHTIHQGEGGEQGDPLMPALFSLGQQPALQAVQEHLLPGETLYAFLDDIYAVVQPHRVRPVYDLLAHHLQAHAHIRLNQGKTRVWNRGGLQPPDADTLGPETWVGNRSLPAEQQGVSVQSARKRMCRNSFKTLCASTCLSLNTCHTSKTSKQRGCYCFTRQAPAATTCFGCSRQPKQHHLHTATTSKSAGASPDSCKRIHSQSMQLHGLTCPLQWGAWGS